MVEKKAQQRWYSPTYIAARANDGFLGIVRSTGAAFRQVEEGTIHGATSVKRMLAKPPPPPPEKKRHIVNGLQELSAKDKAVASLSRDAPVPAPARPAAPQQPVAPVAAANVVTPAPVVAPVPGAPLPVPAVTLPAVEAVVAAAPEAKVPEVVVVTAAAAPEAKAPEVAVVAAAPAPQVEQEVTTLDVEAPEAPAGAASSWWRRPKTAAKATTTAAAEPAPAVQAVAPPRLQAQGISVDQWLASLALADRSQRVQVGAAADDLLQGSEVVRRSAARVLLSLGLAAEPIFVEYTRSKSASVVETCLESLVQLGSKKLAQLLPRIAAAPEEALRLVALRVAQHLDQATRRPLLLAALRDSKPLLRRRALTYLGWQHAGWAKADILRLCYDADATVKWAALECLVAIEPAEARARLDGMYPKMDAVLRRRAVRLSERQHKPLA